MQAIRKIIKSKNKKMVIEIPDDFNFMEYEVIILPVEEKKQKQEKSLIEFFTQSPLKELNLERNEDYGREINI